MSQKFTVNAVVSVLRNGFRGSRVESRTGRPAVVPPSALTDRRWTEPTALTAPDQRIEDAAQDVATGDVLDRADALCAWTHAQFEYRFGVTDVRTTAALIQFAIREHLV
jgi:hypothetical protein